MTLRQLFSRGLVVGLVLTSIAVGTFVAAAQVGTQTYSDGLTGVAFTGPRGLHVTPSTQGLGRTTTEAIFSTFANPADHKTRVPNIAEELVIRARVVDKPTHQDLRAFAEANWIGIGMTITESAQPNGLILQGNFHPSGPRKILLVEKDPSAVLVVDAFPMTSKRIAIFEALLASLEVK